MFPRTAARRGPSHELYPSGAHPRLRARRVPVDPIDVYFFGTGDDTVVPLRSKIPLRDVRPLGTLLEEITTYAFRRVHCNHAVNLACTRKIRRRMVGTSGKSSASRFDSGSEGTGLGFPNGDIRAARASTRRFASSSERWRRTAGAHRASTPTWSFCHCRRAFELLCLWACLSPAPGIFSPVESTIR